MTRLPRQSRRAGPGRRWLEGRSLATLLASLGALLAAMAAASGAHAQFPSGLGEGPPGAEPSISADGRYVAFSSRADDLSAEDNDSFVNIFVRDLQTNAVTLVSRASGASGPPADLWSVSPSISADGRYVAFESVAHNLSAEDHDLANIFVRDLQTSTTTLVSRATGASGEAGNGGSVGRPSISADGRFVAFQSVASNLGPDVATSDIFVRDLQASTTTLVSRASDAAGAPADSYSETPSISADGRFVAFQSEAHNLSAESVAGTFVRDLQRNTTTLVSRANAASGAPADLGSLEPSISADGRFVAFASLADNLSADDNDVVGVACFPIPHGSSYCVDVRVTDIFVRDLQAYTTTFASRASGATGAAADYGGNLGEAFREPVSREPSISADGRYVAFSSQADNLSAEDDDDVRDIFVRDQQTNTTTLVSRAGGAAGEPYHDRSAQPSISADGRYVAFSSDRCGAGEIEGTNIYVRDLQSESTTLVGRDPLAAVCPFTPATPTPPPDTVIAGRASAAKTQKQHGKRIVVKVKVKAKEQLTAKASGKIKIKPTYKLKSKKAQVAGGKTKTLKLKPKKKGQAKRIVGALKRGKKATAKLTVKLTDVAGNSETEKLRVKLKR